MKEIVPTNERLHLNRQLKSLKSIRCTTLASRKQTCSELP